MALDAAFILPVESGTTAMVGRLPRAAPAPRCPARAMVRLHSARCHARGSAQRCPCPAATCGTLPRTAPAPGAAMLVRWSGCTRHRCHARGGAQHCPCPAATCGTLPLALPCSCDGQAALGTAATCGPLPPAAPCPALPLPLALPVVGWCPAPLVPALGRPRHRCHLRHLAPLPPAAPCPALPLLLALPRSCLRSAALGDRWGGRRGAVIADEDAAVARVALWHNAVRGYAVAQCGAAWYAVAVWLFIARP